MDTKKQTQQLVVKDFELQDPERQLTEADLLDWLSEHIAYLIEKRMEYLLNTLYRLDVDEKKMHTALSPYALEPANIGLAKLVIERQKKRAETKIKYKQEGPEDWEAF